MIPEDWRLSSMGHEAELLTGFPFSSSGFTKSGVRLLRGSNVKRGAVDWSTDITQYWPAVGAKTQPYELRAGDLVIAMDGALVGRSFATMGASDLPALLVQRVARLRSKKSVQGLLRAWVASDYFVRHVDLVKTHTAIPHISPKDIHQFAVVVPSAKAEQEAIAEALSDVDALLSGLDRLIAKKRDLKQAAMQQLLTGQTRLPGFQGEWEMKRLGDLGVFLKGSGVKKDDARSGDLPCVRYGEIYTHHNDCIRSFNSWISHDVAKTATRLKSGDLLFAGSGETKAEIGKCVAFVQACEAYAGGDIVILRPVDVDSLFMGYYCNTSQISAQKASKGQGDAVVHISSAALGSISVAVPALAEQSAIATVLSDMDAELTALGARRDKTRLLKQGMMQELLTGRTRLV
jgi:type I restriction enzyme S subunit